MALMVLDRFLLRDVGLIYLPEGNVSFSAFDAFKYLIAITFIFATKKYNVAGRRRRLFKVRKLALVTAIFSLTLRLK